MRLRSFDLRSDPDQDDERLGRSRAARRDPVRYDSMLLPISVRSHMCIIMIAWCDSVNAYVWYRVVSRRLPVCTRLNCGCAVFIRHALPLYCQHSFIC